MYSDVRAINEMVQRESAFVDPILEEAVSYTHLTLPTICSV